MREKTGMTHVDWTLHLVDKFLVESEKSNACNSYESIAHAMVEANPEDLKTIMQTMETKSTLELRELLALGWRIVGNEFRDDDAVVREAAKNLMLLVNGYRRASKAFGEHLFEEEQR